MDISHIEQKLDAITAYVEEATKTSTAFVAEQTPLYVKELLQLAAADNTVSALIALTLIVFSAILIRCVKRTADAVTHDADRQDLRHVMNWNNSPVPVLACILLYSVIMYQTCSLVYHTREVIKVTIAPRIWLVEYVATTIKSNEAK